MRRFLARPVADVLSAIGRDEPKPAEVKRHASMRISLIIWRMTVLARSSERRLLSSLVRWRRYDLRLELLSPEKSLQLSLLYSEAQWHSR